MVDDLKKILSLQEVDSRIDRASAEMEEIPREKRIHERDLESQRIAHEKEQKKIEDIRESNAEYTNEKETYTKRLAEFKNRLLEMKTNEAYRAMIEQIKYSEKKISDFESRMLELMYEEEDAEKSLEEARKIWERNKQRFEKKQSILDEQLKVLEKNMIELMVEREEVASDISKRLINKYEQLRTAGKGLVVVGLQKGSCGGCLTNVPPQTAVEISQGKTFTCPICGCFVIWTEDSSFAGSG